MVGRLFCLLCVSLLLATLGATVASAAVYPDVILLYDSETSTYTYRVTVDWEPGISYPFGHLMIFCQASGWDPINEVDTWDISGPIVGGVDQGWMAYFNPAGDVDTAEWRSSTNQEVMTSWVGDFVIVAPNTAPVAGMGMTKDGVDDSINVFEISVPGMAPVPEPSCMFALAGLSGLAFAGARRRLR